MLLEKVYRLDACPDCGAWLNKRSDPQNAKLHAMISDIAAQKEWAGQKLTIEEWKRLLVAAFERAQQRPAKFFPALDGQGFDVVYKRTSRMGKQEMVDLISYVEYWATDNGVELAA